LFDKFKSDKSTSGETTDQPKTELKRNHWNL